MASSRPTKTFTYTHPTLGPLTGLLSPDNVVQFRAIPYATIPRRFEQSVLVSDLSIEKERSELIYSMAKPHFTSSSASPQTLPSHEVSGGPFPGEESPWPMDEFKCLILQVNVPLATLEASENEKKLKDLPVLAYIHGGAFALGKIDDHHSTALMVQQSIIDNQPIISVSIQYRLGPLGFLNPPSSPQTNLALYDQRNALLWIQNFIAGFGGNPRNVTAFGESAGSMSICYHMLSSVPLFHRVILMSGILGPISSPMPKERAERMYEMLLQELEIQEKGEEGLERLRGVDVRKIVEAGERTNSTSQMWLPVQDEEWFGGHVTWDRIPSLLESCEWVNTVVLGGTGFEGITPLALAFALAMAPTSFTEAATEQLGHENAGKLFEAYGITPDMDPNQFLTPVMRWIGDVIFDGPTHMLARHLSTSSRKKVYRYNFDVRNPFPGQPLYQISHHWVDIYFVFKNYQFRFSSQKLKDISTQHARFWIDIANGKAPWNEYKEEGVVMIANERDGWTERTKEEDERITERNWRRCERLWEAYSGFKGQDDFIPFKMKSLEDKKLV
ncbi:alpha/beta-hydrolase [Delitschia confertaspora ATCC 74209]|uniref:Alpha/beta-hydrolase n=1 Tax=Delitschia confertaspora ATCC 74209 TaxID=1513339 RepID=A0A9P4MS34_9PLEO|nr:alpha/beta-hydrolase [Delitschia confertaspora ATCC 74209]